MSIGVGKLGVTSDEGLVASNPFEALLPPQKLRELKSMPDTKRQEFYGRVVESVFSDPSYQRIVSAKASDEFSNMKGGSDISRDEIVDAVMAALKARG